MDEKQLQALANELAKNLKTPEDLSPACFKVIVAFCNKITLCSLFFWIQVDF